MSRLLILLAWAWVAGCQAPPASGPAPQVEPAAAAPAQARQAPVAPPASTEAAGRYDLGRDEARGGHTLARHVGRSDDQLRERLRREPRISAASTYTDLATAERTVFRTLSREGARVRTWLARQGPRPNLALDYRGQRGDPIGRSLTRRHPQPVACWDAVVVLRWDGRGGYVVLTSYPEASR